MDASDIEDYLEMKPIFMKASFGRTKGKRVLVFGLCPPLLWNEKLKAVFDLQACESCSHQEAVERQVFQTGLQAQKAQEVASHRISGQKCVSYYNCATILRLQMT